MRPLTGLILISLPLSLGGCGIPVEMTVASYAADAGLLWFTDKSSNDHLLSMVAGQDCAMWRLIKGRQICADHKPGEENPYDIDYTAPHREVGEGGMVTVYTASRQGGRLLMDQEAAAALRAPPAMATQAPAAAPVLVAADPPAGRRTAERSDPVATLPTEATVSGPPRKPATSARTERGRIKSAATSKPPPTVVRRPASAAARSAPPAVARRGAPVAAAQTAPSPAAGGPSPGTATAASGTSPAGALPEAAP